MSNHLLNKILRPSILLNKPDLTIFCPIVENRNTLYSGTFPTFQLTDIKTNVTFIVRTTQNKGGS